MTSLQNKNIVFEPGFDDLVDEHPLWEAGTTYGFPEGPVFFPQGFMVFSDISYERIIRYCPPFWNGVLRENSGGANGNTLDTEGRFISCEGNFKRLTRTEPDGTITVLADSYDGKHLNAPNDVVVRSDGTIFFTDPIFMGDYEDVLAPSLMTQTANRVFRLDTDGVLTPVTEEVSKPNGLAFSPDESVLYVVNSEEHNVAAFDVDAAGALTNYRIWLDMEHRLDGPGDGMKIDTRGNGYVTGPGGVWVCDPEGTPLGIIRTPGNTTNCAFYGFDSKLLFITATTGTYVIRLKVPGISVYDRGPAAGLAWVG
jgi:gluconolactonase